jgi:YidC/Oxa1 family membrane protein insertase
MDRNTIIGLVLIMVILIGYSFWMTPSDEEMAAKKFRQDSIYQANKTRDSIAFLKYEEQRIQDSIRKSQVVPAVQTLNDSSVISVELKDKFGVFAAASQGEDKIYTLESDLMKLFISSKGGKIVSVELPQFQTYDSLPLIMFKEDKTNFGISFFANGDLFNTGDLYFEPYFPNGFPSEAITVGKTESKSLSMRLYTEESDPASGTGSYIEFLYTLKGDNYMLDFDVNFVDMSSFVDPGTNFVDLNWSTELLKLEKSVDRFNGPTVYYKFFQDDVDYLSETKDDEEILSTSVKWITFKHRFFSSTLVAKDHFLNAKIKAFNLENQPEEYIRSMEAAIGLPLDLKAGGNIPMSFYFGPNKFNILKKYDLDMERQVPLGWSFFLLAWINRYAVLPVFNFLEGFGWNYGIIILVLTVLLKIVLFPIAYKSYSSSAKMRVLKPDIEELGKKFPKKEDAMKKQSATMALYKQAGVNPMAGCVPMLLQFPILIAMFRFFPAAFELRQQSFLWAEDLSTYDSILSLPFTIPFYGDHVSLFTLLMTISTLIYTYMNQEMMGTSQQMPGMKTMMYLMPLMFLGMFNGYASGLSYYYFLANVITFSQMFFIRKTIDESKIRLKIEQNKKKPPKKKSNWQKRLEDAAKQKGYQPPKKKK